ncbi:MAG: hypothetical protein KDE14_14225 [Rhodobacteraceae bacterium]|nr:hypothetical protein [Paracoccaceae bacterium]
MIALRDRLFSGLAVVLIASFAISLFLGNAALVEKSEAGHVFAAGSARFILILGFSIFVALQTQRLFESREIEAVLSRAISRPRFVLGYWLGFAVAVLAIELPFVAGLFWIYGLSGDAVIWALSLSLECLVMLAFTIFAAVTFERAMSTILVSGSFYVLTRLTGFFLGIREATPDVGANRVVNPMLDGVGMVVPRLDLMTQSRWLVYGVEPTDPILLVMVQVSIFIAIALCAAAFDLQRKQF